MEKKPKEATIEVEKLAKDAITKEQGILERNWDLEPKNNNSLES